MSDRPVELAEDGFLNRWSRLKSQPQSAESQPVALNEVDDTSVELLDGAAEAVVEAEPLTDADMPDIDTLDEKSDFSGFFSEKVSEQLRRKALNKLFHLPEFNIRDGLNEYDEDYSTFVPLGDTVTYHMKQFIERQKQQFDEALQDEDVVEERECTEQQEADTAVTKLADMQQQSEQDDVDELGACE
ncbi:MAG: DUF3306 domain-containing protein [Halopseudomonas sp.]